MLLLGDTKAAIEAAQSDCTILENLLAAGSSTVSPQQRAALQTDLSFGYRYLGYALEAAGRREEALAAFQKSLTIAETLAEADPKNTNVQLILATAYEKVGDVLVAVAAGLARRARRRWRPSPAMEPRPVCRRRLADVCLASQAAGSTILLGRHHAVF